jgi:hypothetical protein
LVIYVNVITKKRFSLSNLDAKLAELGNRTPWIIEKEGSLRVMRRKDNQNYPGRVRIGEIPEQRLIYASGVSPASAHAEERLTYLNFFSNVTRIFFIFRLQQIHTTGLNMIMKT